MEIQHNTPYIINTSFMVEGKVHEAWLRLMQERYLPFLVEQGFTRRIFTRMLASEQEAHFTYSLQLPIDSLEHYHRLIEEVQREYERSAQELFGEQVLHFTTLLKQIEIE